MLHYIRKCNYLLIEHLLIESVHSPILVLIQLSFFFNLVLVLFFNECMLFIETAFNL